MKTFIYILLPFFFSPLFASSSFLNVSLEKLMAHKSIPMTEFSQTSFTPWNNLLIGKKIIALGESDHGLHQFPKARNFLFQYLVLEHGVKTIVLESGMLEAHIVDEYINGRSTHSLKEVLEKGFTHGMGLWKESQELIEWMKSYNQLQKEESQKLHFMGMDLTKWGDAPYLALQYLDHSPEKEAIMPLAYKISFLTQSFEKIYQDYLNDPKAIIDPDLLDAFGTIGFDQLSDFEKKSFEDGLKALSEQGLPIFQKEALLMAQQMLSNLKSRDLFRKVYQYDKVLSLLHRANLDQKLIIHPERIMDPLSSKDLINCLLGRESREKGLAESVAFIEQNYGKVMLYAHNGHLMKAPLDINLPPLYIGKEGGKGAGEYLSSLYRDNYFLIGGTVGMGEGVEEALKKEDSLEKIFLSLPYMAPAFFLFIHDKDLTPYLIKDRPFRWQTGFQRLNIKDSFDALLFIREVSKAFIYTEENDFLIGEDRHQN